MESFTKSITGLKTIFTAIIAGMVVWEVINLIEVDEVFECGDVEGEVV